MKSIKLLLKKEYQIEAKEIEVLVGYANLNYKVKDANGSRYILKEYEFDEELMELISAESYVLSILDKKFRGAFPETVSTTRCEFYVENKESNKTKIFRLLSWLDGTFLFDVLHTNELLLSFGEFLAKMDIELMNISSASIKARRIEWDLQYLLELNDRVSYISDAETKKYIQHFLIQYKENVVHLIPGLRKSTIHNDANDMNVLARNGMVSGMIDFGDMVYAPLINELAVAITYMLYDKADPIQTACQMIQAYHKVLPLQQIEVDQLYYLIAGRLCMSLLNSAYSSRNEPGNEYISVSEKGAKDLIKKWITINPVYAQNEFRKVSGFNPEKVSSIDDALEKRFKHISKAQSVSYKKPIRMAGASFQYMYDVYGNTFLDAYNNIPHVGHQHPKVVEAGQKQMARLNTNTRYVYDLLANYSERLLDKFPKPLNKVFFVNSGSAASDLAIRMAQTYSGSKNLMVMEHGYHGHTRLGIDISHYKFGRKGGKGQADYILKAPIPDTFRGEFKKNDGTAGKQFAKQAINLLNNYPDKIVAFIAEPVVGCAGQVPLAKGYLNELYPAIRAQGGVCISDEVQTGFGRLGSHFWGFELLDVVPDIVVLGKPMGNGHPMGAVITTDKIANSFDNGMEFFSSFGGNPVSCAIGMAVLDVIEEEGLQQNALETGAYFKQLLKELKNKHDSIGDVRGEGLFLGLEFISDTETLLHNTILANHIKNEMREKHILVSTDGPMDNIIKMKPPLCFNKNNALTVVESIDEIIRNYQAK